MAASVLQPPEQQQHDALQLDVVLERVMGCLTQRERLGSPSLVSSRWRDAAVAATNTAGVAARFSQHAAVYLQRYGHTGLQQLSVWRGQLGDAPWLASLPHLTSLQLADATGRPALLQRLGDSNTALQHLLLANLDWGPLIGTSDRAELNSAVHWACRRLTLLTALELEGCDLDDGAVTQQSSRLPRLRLLALSGNQLQHGRALAPLPPRLTELRLSGNHRDLDVGELLAASHQDSSNSAEPQQQQQQQQQQQPDEPPSPHSAAAAAAASSSSTQSSSAPEQQQQHLCALEVGGLCMRQPRLLAGLTSLTRLVARGLAIPHEQQPQLLRSVAALTRLRCLDLSATLTAVPCRTHVSELRGVLLALTQLTALDISSAALRCEGCLAPAAAGAGAAALPSPQQQQQDGERGPGVHHRPGAAQALLDDVCLPQLASLAASDVAAGNARDWDVLSQPLFGLAELAGAVSRACPRLQALHAHGSFGGCPAFDDELAPAMAALAPRLTALHLSSHFCPPGDEQLSALAALSRLQRLVLEHDGDSAVAMTDGGLASLTALSCLTELCVSELGPGVSEQLQGPTSCSGGSSSFRSLHLVPHTNKAGRVTKSVTAQLRERCERSPQLWREHKQELQAQLEQARAATKAAQKEARLHKRRADEAQVQLAELQAQLAGLSAARTSSTSTSQDMQPL